MKYRLETPHYISEAYLYMPAGSEIGDGTDVPYSGPPSNFMVPLDDEAKAAVAKMREHRAAQASSAIIAEGSKAVIEAATKALPEVTRSSGPSGATADKRGNLPGQAPKNL